MANEILLLIEKLRQLTAEVLSVVEDISEEDWQKISSAENWPVGFVVRHIGLGYGNTVKWVDLLLKGEAIPTTGEDIHAANAQALGEFKDFGKGEALAFLNQQSATLEQLVLSLDEAQLAASVPMALVGGQIVNVPFLVDQVLSRHTRGHLESIKQATGQNS